MPVFTHDAAASLVRLLRGRDYHVVTPRAELADALGTGAEPILIPDTEDDKSLATLSFIWSRLQRRGARRNSLLVAVGGGLTTDTAGLAAALYMRGIPYINIPTTLLAMVDASTGGKTAVNFGGVKNLIGAFYPPEHTIISPQWLATLPTGQILSGYAEMLKHALLISPAATARLLAAEPLQLNAAAWLPLIRESVEFKQSVVQADPREHGRRRILNLGHTFGHALEALSISDHRPITHGHAVAYGLVCALVLSHMHAGFPEPVLQQVAAFVREHYEPRPILCSAYNSLFRLMHADKKNRDARTAFTLLRAPGDPLEAVPLTDTQILPALDITRSLLSL